MSEYGLSRSIPSDKGIHSWASEISRRVRQQKAARKAVLDKAEQTRKANEKAYFAKRRLQTTDDLLY